MADGGAPAPDVGGQSAYWLLARAGDTCASCRLPLAESDGYGRVDWHADCATAVRAADPWAPRWRTRKDVMKGNRGNPSPHRLTEAERQKGREARSSASYRRAGRAGMAEVERRGTRATLTDEERAKGQKAGGAATKKKGRAYFVRLGKKSAAARAARRGLAVGA